MKKQSKEAVCKSGEVIGADTFKWKTHNGINCYLPDRNPEGGLMTVPLKWRGLTVGKEFLIIAMKRSPGE